jgi:heme exporter protein CcmD
MGTEYDFGRISMMELLAMGKYGAFVWSSFALMFIVMIACVGQARARHRRVWHDIEVRLKATESAN